MPVVMKINKKIDSMDSLAIAEEKSFVSIIPVNRKTNTAEKKIKAGRNFSKNNKMTTTKVTPNTMAC